MLATHNDDFQHFAEKLAKVSESGSLVVFGAQKDLEKANAELPAELKMTITSALLAKK